MRVASALGRLAGEQVVGAQVGQHGHLGVEQRHVDHLALTGGVAVSQGCQDRHRGVHPCEQVGHGHPHLLWAAAGAVVAFAGDAHQATHALHGVVVACTVAIRSGLAEAGDRAIHQPRVQAPQAGSVQAVTRHVADLEVFDHHVTACRQLQDQRAPFGLRNVHRHRPLVAVGAQEVGGVRGIAAVAVLQKRRAPAAGVVATRLTGAGRPFDLDDFSAKVGQGLRAPRAGQHARQVEHLHAVQRARGQWGVVGLHAMNCPAGVGIIRRCR